MEDHYLPTRLTYSTWWLRLSWCWITVLDYTPRYTSMAMENGQNVKMYFLWNMEIWGYFIGHVRLLEGMQIWKLHILVWKKSSWQGGSEPEFVGTSQRQPVGICCKPPMVTDQKSHPWCQETYRKWSLCERISLIIYTRFCVWLSTAGRIISTAICGHHSWDIPCIWRFSKSPRSSQRVFCWMAVVFVVALHRQVLNTIPLRSQIPRCHDRKKGGLFGKAEVALVDICGV